MATLTVRNLEATMIEKLKARATQNGRSMEAEARAILAEATERTEVKNRRRLGTDIASLFAGLDTSDLEFQRNRELPRDIFEE